jgi:drug/metabolite transporter (DMT)-like permease
MILGLSLALVCALGTNLSALFKARGAVLARPIHARHPVRSATDLFRQRWFAIGWILALFAWGLHIEALALAPLSLVQVVLSGGLVFLAVLAERCFGYHLGRRQWAGVMITAIGLVVIGLTARAEGPQRSSLAALIAVETGILALGVGLVRISMRQDIQHRREALLLAIAAGVLFGVSDVAIKYLTHAHGPVFGLLSPWTLTALIAFVVSFYASARSLQIGLAVEVIALTSVAANLSAILGGVLVFGEPIGSGAVGIVGRLLAFGLVVAGAALVPAPLRATSNELDPQSAGSPRVGTNPQAKEPIGP